MDDLSDKLRAAVAGAPPTRIDLDRLIAAEHRRSRTVTWSAAGTGVAALVAAVLILPGALAGGGDPGSGNPGGVGPGAMPSASTGPGPMPSASTGPAPVALCVPASPEPSGPPAPTQSHDTVRARPTEAPENAVRRLTTALRGELTKTLPAGTTVKSAHEGCRAVQFQYLPERREYEALGWVVRGSVANPLWIRVMPSEADEAIPCPASDNPRDCERIEQPNGDVTVIQDQRVGPTDMVQRTVLARRADGTTVYLLTANYTRGAGGNSKKSSPEPFLTTGQLAGLGRTAGLTLYP